jgi:O-antigen biosynthesis alpha-1,2-mannosyltransferase
LIPLAFPDRYLAERNARRWYLPRLELVRGADAVVAVSESAAEEVVSRLDVRRDRIVVSYEDCGSEFAPSPDGEAAALERARAAVPGLRRDFILYVGGIDPRKNVGALFSAYAQLDPPLRERHQLVLAGPHLPHELRELEPQLARLGVERHVVRRGLVSDAVLSDLYRSCATFVLPSLHEGFGLPALEAMRCGAPVLVSDSTALRELVTWSEARFAPDRPAELASLLRRVLTEPELAARLRVAGLVRAGTFSWAKSCDAVMEAHRRAAAARTRLR